MDSCCWKVKLWKYTTPEQAEKQLQAKKKWVEKWKCKYQFRTIFVNNAYAVEYRLLYKL